MLKTNSGVLGKMLDVLINTENGNNTDHIP